MNELYGRLEALCARKGVTVSAMCKASGVSRSVLTDLKMGRQNSLSAGNLQKLAGYFGVSVETLLGTREPEVTMDSFTYAMYQEGQALTEENKQRLLEMAKFFRQQQEKGN